MVDFIKEAETIQQQVVLWRRDLHQCPELLLDLPKTSAYVERELQKWDMKQSGSVSQVLQLSLIVGNREKLCF